MLHLFVIDQHESVIIVHTPTPSEASLPFLITPPEVTDHQPGVPGYTATFHQLCILHLAGHIRLCYFLHSSHSLRPRLCPQIHSLRLCLYSCTANRLIHTIFLDSTYMCYYTIFVILFLIYFTMYQTLGSSTWLEMTQFLPFHGCIYTDIFRWTNKHYT